MGAPTGTLPGTDAQDNDPRGVGDKGTKNRLGPAVSAPGTVTVATAAESHRADYRDAYRAELVSRYTEEQLAAESIATLLIITRQSASAVSEGWGPRTMYVQATNVLILYRHLLGRAHASARDRDGALLTTQQFSAQLVPWTGSRIRRVEDMPEFQPDKVARWNSIVALGPPPPYDPGRPWNGTRPQKLTLIKDYRPLPGIEHGAGAIQLPFGLYGVIRPGGPDARILYRLLKTAEMNSSSPEGRKAILAAVIAQILQNKQADAWYDEMADAMNKRDAYSSGDVVRANNPRAFDRTAVAEEFRFEVGLSFLQQLDDVTDGLVDLKTMQLLEPGLDVMAHEPRPIWQELYPHNSLRERMQWIWKRYEDANARYDPTAGRPKPGHFYPGNDMFYVADGMFAGDQIWATKDGRIFAVNERAEMIEAFRQGVMAAAGMVAVAYFQIALALILVEAPAIAANIARLVTAPAEATGELLQMIRANPLKVLGAVALDQASSFVLSDDKEHWLNTFGDAKTWLQVFFAVLMFKDLRKIVMPSGGTFVRIGEDLHFIPSPQATAGEAIALDSPNAPALSNADDPLLSGARGAPPSSQATRPTTVDEGASVIIREQPTPPASIGDPARKPPSATLDTPRSPPDSAGDVPARATEVADSAKVQDPKAIAAKGTADDATASTTSGRYIDDRLGGAQREAEEAQAVEKLSNKQSGTTKRSTKKGGSRGGALKAEGGSNKAVSGSKRSNVKPANEESKGKPGGERDARRGDTDTGTPEGSAAKSNRGASNRGTGEQSTIVVRDGIRYRLSISGEGRVAFEAIPVGETVVYTFHNQQGEVIYVGITTKNDERDALVRLFEHLSSKDGPFIAEAGEFRIRGHYADEAEAHALEQHLIDLNPGTRTYNRDQNPWTTYVNYRKSIADRYPRTPTGVDQEMSVGSSARGKPDPDYTSKLPAEMARPIRFNVKFEDGLPNIRGPDPDGGPGVHPDADTPFDPTTEL